MSDSQQAPIPESEWQWIGTASHFSCGRWCRYHLATIVGDVLVSTVGEFVYLTDSGTSEPQEDRWLRENWPGREIGSGRKYETMAFRICGAVDDDPYDDVPSYDPTELALWAANDRRTAQRNHMEACRTYAENQEHGADA